MTHCHTQVHKHVMWHLQVIITHRVMVVTRKGNIQYLGWGEPNKKDICQGLSTKITWHVAIHVYIAYNVTSTAQNHTWNNGIWKPRCENTIKYKLWWQKRAIFSIWTEGEPNKKVICQGLGTKITWHVATHAHIAYNVTSTALPCLVHSSTYWEQLKIIAKPTQHHSFHVHWHFPFASFTLSSSSLT